MSFPRVLPTAALRPSDVPPADAPDIDVLRFATSINGYEDLGHGGFGPLRERLAADGPDALSLHELRLVLFIRQRAHYHQGGAWGPDDPLMDEMRGLTAEIGRRVQARGPGVGVWRGDITRLAVDAVVNAANERMLGGGGVDGAIHRAAGPKLVEACRAVPEVRPGVRCPTGEARITPGFQLPADSVIHTVGPVWRGGGAGEDDLLTSAYRSSLSLAEAEGVGSMAFPAISTGVYGFPADRAARIAVETIRQWQAAHARPVRVVLVAFDAASEPPLRAALADDG